ncbi:luciferase [Phytohabitans suffuscus]|uniref:Luciferase n=2 Tax=Phytohabitans suffuscus TaxID=624315 RepID=A0A6F8YBB5_9ACTN|nr:LLM class flavin-dependent oxidoreductase [Phytohabitans suffuscus]BCB83278.1 luciferase [Phytohabitans suffuscus]
MTVEVAAPRGGPERVRAGIVILPDQRWSAAAGRWRRAEEYGFAHAWTYDHLGWRDLVDGPWFDAVPTLSAAAGVTSRIRLGTMVASPNFRHPAHFAREVTALDDICGGRLTIGVGGGGVAGFDNTVLGGEALAPRERVDRFTEFLEVLDPLLRGEPVTYRGRYYTAVDARGTPGCVQAPRVPLVLAALGPRSMRLVARFGAGWVTTVGRMESLEDWWRAAAGSVARFEDVVSAAGRDPSTVDRYVSLDSAPVYSLSSAGYYAEAVGRAAACGFTDVLSHWPRASSWYAGDEAVLEEVAGGVLPTLGG